jgi:hypothetical protein
MVRIATPRSIPANTGRRFSVVLVAAPIASLLVAALATVLPAQAGALTRTFVSSTGVDTNPCTIAAPCASFAAAYAAVAANGIVAALDPGKYGPLTITTGVTINGNGWSAITAPASGTGITVTAGTANVALIGLEIDGAQAGYNGIVVNSAGSLTVTNCTLQNFVNGAGFAGIGIAIEPTGGAVQFAITNTKVLNNQNIGIAYYPPSGSATADGVIDHVVATGNFDGIYVNTASTSGAAVIAISNSIASNNANDGIVLENNSAGPSLTVSIDNVSAAGNFQGIFANNTTNVLLGRSVITGNSDGIENVTSPNTIYSYRDNRINLNTSFDITGNFSTLNTTDSQR